MSLSVPGDKSISQRALILAGLATGRSRLSGILPGSDPRSTADALRALGVRIPPLPADGGPIEVEGRGLRGLVPPADPLDLGNSGTGARLLMGVLAGQPFSCTLTGDASLRSRPMRRVTEPLAGMGARFEELETEGRLPIRVHGGPLEPLEYDLPVASAQVKSALLLAGLVGGTSVRLTEPGRSRDHTERMLAAVGATLRTGTRDVRRYAELLDPPASIHPLDLRVPGDFSSAAFFIVLGLLGGAGEELVLENVGLNPTRTGLLVALGRMGASIDVEPRGQGPEPTGTLIVRPSELVATEVGGHEMPTMLDEVPALAIAAARARGTTSIRGAGELRVKETDRIRALALGLRAVGVRVEESDDGLEIEGTDAPLKGGVRSFDDHRIAMAFGVADALAGCRVEVDDRAVVDVSYPGFWDDLERVRRGEAAPGRAGASGTAAGRADPLPYSRTGELEALKFSASPSSEPPERTQVTLDGPAGSGKSTTAREVAARLGWRYLDSGALYRALTWTLLEEGVDPARWPDLDEADLSALGVEVDASGDALVVRRAGHVLDEELREERVTSRVSKLAALPAVRGWLLSAQRAAGARGRLVADGRDMGTVVFPDAATKIFLDADPRERARRRLRDKGVPDPDDAAVEEEAARLRRRDREDSEREHSPLRVPEGALILDTTALDFEEQVERIVREARKNAGRDPGS